MGTDLMQYPRIMRCKRRRYRDTASTVASVAQSIGYDLSGLRNAIGQPPPSGGRGRLGASALDPRAARSSTACGILMFQRVGRLEIDDQVELGGQRSMGKIARLRPLRILST